MRFFTYIVLIGIGAIIGGSVMWISSYYPKSEYVDDKISIADILGHSRIAISKSNFSCQGTVDANVGSVVGSIIELNSVNKRNMLSFGCFQNICTLVVASCAPWQNEECGSRFLKFEIDDANKIQSDTFSCIDIP